MNATELRTKLRRCERNVLLLGLPAILALLVAWLRSGAFYYSAIIGYYLGSISFIVLIEGFVVLEKAPAWANVPALVFSNLKLLFIAMLVFVLSRLGVSVTQMVLGIFASQLAVLATVLWVLYTGHKNADSR